MLLVFILVATVTRWAAVAGTFVQRVAARVDAQLISTRTCSPDVLNADMRLVMSVPGLPHIEASTLLLTVMFLFLFDRGW